MATPARALRPAPARRPRPEVSPRPRPAQPAPRRLRLVDDARVKAAHRRRRARLVVAAAAIAATGLLFALAAFNAMLVSGQGRLDELERHVADAQAEYSASRLRVAELEAPERIVQVAQRRLGMRLPDDVRYLTPSAAQADEVGTAAVQERPVTQDGSGTSGWASVKPYLAGRP